MKGARIAWIEAREYDEGEMIDFPASYNMTIIFKEPSYNEELYDKVVVIPLEDEE